MNLRRRLAVLAGAAVAIAVAAASVGLYLSARDGLLHEVDQSLLSRLEALDTDRVGREPPDSRPQTGLGTVDDPLESDQPFGGTSVFTQIVASGAVEPTQPEASRVLPVGDRERAVAAGGEPLFFADVRLEGEHLRVLTGPIRPGLAAQLARPLTEVDATLSRMRWILAGITAAGLLLGALSGRLVARSAIGPIRRLGRATRRVRSSRDLSARVEVSGRDELAELANDFNAMLEALEASHRSQQGLVADASHELRTPVTSLRTYLEFLRREPDLPAAEHDQVLGHAVDQVEELTGLIADLVELARGEQQPVSREPLRLDLLVREAIDAAERRSTLVEFETRLKPTGVNGSPDLVLRAIKNLLDNALKWGPPGAPIEVAAAGGVVTVRDHGPGIAPEDLPRVFDRFYRSREARALPGSGLGLAIVKHVAEVHGGVASAANAPGGGALLTLDLSDALVDVRDHADWAPALDRVWG
jgi:two-component system sensor histidine kinase MprB